MKNGNGILASMRIEGKDTVDLARRDPAAAGGPGNKDEAREALARIDRDLDAFQYALYAEARVGLLVVFQAMDTGGKDGVIRRVFGPLNSQGVTVASFKRPTPVELSHDYLWRVHSSAPAKGMMQIFNRSHYEDVLVHRVHKLVSKKTLRRRYRQINDFERHLAENDTRILKFFLHISKDEQKRRLEERLRNPDKRWKFEMGDLTERKLWDRYQKAYEIAIEQCSRSHAPWFIVPADCKWRRDWAVGEIVRRELKDIDPKPPAAAEGLDKVVVE